MNLAQYFKQKLTTKKQMIKNKRILITGVGSIGSEIARQLAPNNKLFLLDISENAYGLSQELSQKGYWVKPRVGDIRDQKTVTDLFIDFKPQIVIHSAALKEVGAMQLYPNEAIQTNIVGLQNVLHEAYKWECLEKFLFISSDKATNLDSIMGASKRFGEVLVKNAGGISVRFGNVLGSRGSLTQIWQRQYDNGEPLTVTDEKMTRYMMSIKEACSLVITALEQGKSGETWIMKMGEKYNILELAKEITKKTGQEIKIIGIREGETLTENLMFHEEWQRQREIANFYIV